MLSQYRSVVRGLFATFVSFVLMENAFAAINMTADMAVTKLALSDFTKRTDTMAWREDGILLVAPQLSVLTRENVSAILYGNSDRSCKIPSGMVGNLIRRNSATGQAEDLLEKDSRWRVMDSADIAITESDRFYAKSAKGEKIKTVLRLTRPVYSITGDRALVHFSFRWGIHSADANYMLRKEVGLWKVDCSELFHYP
jgi:hypothetical protein